MKIDKEPKCECSPGEQLSTCPISYANDLHIRKVSAGLSETDIKKIAKYVRDAPCLKFGLNERYRCILSVGHIISCKYLNLNE